MALGTTLAPKQSPRPPQRPQQGLGQTVAGPQNSVAGRGAGFMAKMQQNPQLMAFMMNMAANLLTQQGIAGAAGAGLQGIGRYNEQEAGRQKEAELEERRRMEADREFALRAGKLGGRGGGGSGGSGGTVGKDGKIDPNSKAYQTAFNKALPKLLELNESEGLGLTYDEVVGRAHIETLASLGDRRTGNAYLSADEESQRALARAYAGGPSGGYEMLDAFERASSQAQNGPVTPPSDMTTPTLAQGAAPPPVPRVGTPTPQIALPNPQGPAPTIPLDPITPMAVATDPARQKILEQLGVFQDPTKAPSIFTPGY